MDPFFIVVILILIVSVILHELAHGYAAYWLGDPTAQYEGRLTLNPVKHLELFGSFILPFLSYQLGGFLIGWAKPVPYSPYNFKRFARWGEAIVAAAGPIVNITIAVVFAIVFRVLATSGGASDLLSVVMAIVSVNVILAFFNLLPFPPLDGSKILFSVLPRKYDHIKHAIDRFALPIAIIFLIFIWPIFSPVAGGFIQLLLGA